jgi:hypothetical protein
MGKGDAKKGKEQLDALVEGWKAEGREVKLVGIDKQKAAALVAQYDVDAYVVEDADAGGTVVMMLMAPTKLASD